MKGRRETGRESLHAGDRAGGDVSSAHGTYVHSSGVPLPIQLGSFSLLSKTARQNLLDFFSASIERIAPASLNHK